jgi:hypothetical protein
MNTDKPLVEMIHKHVTTKRVKLPAFNGTALRIQKEIAKEEPDTRLIEKSIVSDQSLTGEVLRVSNSSFYRGLSQVATVRDAIIRLGSKEVSNIVTLVALQHNFKSKDPIVHKIMGKLWRHSVGCAMGASWLAKQTGFQTICHETFVAGLLHDVGKLFILKAIDDMKISGEIDHPPSNTLMFEAMQNLHTEQGEVLLKIAITFCSCWFGWPIICAIKRGSLCMKTHRSFLWLPPKRINSNYPKWTWPGWRFCWKTLKFSVDDGRSTRIQKSENRGQRKRLILQS